MAAVFPENEAQRIAGLHALCIVDTPPEADYDDLAHLASAFCGVPVALITLIDHDRQWFKARVGTEATEIPREISFCGHAILVPDRLMVVEDLRQDPRFHDHPLVTGDPQVRFYAGMPIVLDDGAAVGTLCIVDTAPRSLPDAQARAMQALARQVAVLFELRRRVRQVERQSAALEYARDMLGRTGAMAQVGGWELDLTTQRVHWSDEVYRIHEVEPGTDPVLHDALNFYPPEARPAIEAALARALEDGTPWDLELPFVTARGRPLWVRAQGMAVQRKNGRTTLLAGAFQDITDRKRAELWLTESETRLRTITDNLPVLIAEFDTEQRFRFCNATYRDWLGVDPQAVLGCTVQEAVAPEYIERRGALMERALAGEKVSFEQTLDLPMGLRTLQSTYLPQCDADGRVASIYALTTDITTLKDTQRLLDAMARTDLLTGLPNRRHFDERLAEAAARSRRTGSALAVLYLDVDRFKAINDTHGHAAGDLVLCGLAQRLRACLRETDLVARHAGDEFAILLEGAAVPADLSVVGAKLLQAMEAPLVVQGEPLTIGISIGATVYRGGEGSPGELLQRADQALYVAKTEGRGRFHLGDRA